MAGRTACPRSMRAQSYVCLAACGWAQKTRSDNRLLSLLLSMAIFAHDKYRDAVAKKNERPRGGQECISFSC